MSEWKKICLGDVCDLIAGFAFKSGDFGEYQDKALKIGDIKPPYVDYSSMSGIDLSNYSDRNLDKYKVEYDDFVLAMTGATIGKIGRYVEQTPCYINQRVLMFKPRNNVDRKFIYHVLCSNLFQKYIINHIDSESAQPNISANTLSKYSFYIPDLTTQRRIAAILSSLDAQIENNNKVNAKLEEIAQNLFKEWFVDFGPFKNDKFVDSELGPIPEGWRVGSVYEYVNVVYGAPYKSDKFNENGLGLPLIRIRDLKTNKPQVSTEEILPQTEYVEAGDIVAGMDAEFIPFIWKGEKGLLNQRVCKLKPQVVGIDDLFVMYLMLPHLIFTQSYKVGTTVSHIGKSDFDKFVSVLPPLDIVLHFSEKIAPMRSEIVRLSKETRELATLRDTLLPKLMSGEIEV